MAEDSKDPAATPPRDGAPDDGAAASEAAPEALADPWSPFDPVLEAFATARSLAIGTYWAEQTAAAEGRFVQWANTSGWRCTLELVHAPEEKVVVLVALGPPLPGGRARVLALGGFPQEGDETMLRAALELGYGIAETWGPAAEPPGPAATPGTGEPNAGAAQATQQAEAENP